MANKQSAIKELRKTKKRTVHNQRIKTNVRFLYKQCTEQIKDGNLEEAKKTAALFQKTTDKASKRHVISVNRARRKVASLTKSLKSAPAPTSEKVPTA